MKPNFEIKTGGTGHWPVPDGTRSAHLGHGPAEGSTHAPTIPRGGSPRGTGQWPVPPVRDCAFTRLELAALLAALALLAAIALPALASPRQRSQRVQCANNLRQIFVASQLWGHDHGERVPWEVSLADGGTMRHSLTVNPWLHFSWLSNELVSPVVLLCPSDTGQPARDFSLDPNGGYVHPNFANRATSYFLSHSRNGLPTGMMAGDRNLSYDATVSSCPNFTAAFVFYTQPQTGGGAWNTNLHNGAGNLMRLDGQVAQLTTRELQSYIRAAPPDDNGSMHFITPR